MSDLVNLARDAAKQELCFVYEPGMLERTLWWKLADRIEELERQVEMLRLSLKAIKGMTAIAGYDDPGNPMAFSCASRALAATEPKEPKA